jgi:hypothetical protein
MRAIAFLSLGLLAFVALAGAQTPGSPPGPGAVRILPAEITTPKFAAGLPDQGFDANWEWQALVCRKQCELQPLKLAMAPVMVHPYDGEPLPGHRYGLDRQLEATPLVLLRELPAGARNKPDSWLHAGLGAYPPAASPGTMDIDIPLPRGGKARIVPRHAGVVGGNHVIKVYLESGPTRQLLAELPVDPIVGPAGLPRGTALLRWAGDLDGDGRLDLIMSLSSRAEDYATATLFLSSAAGPGELAGRAASFEYWPIGLPGC